MITDLLTWLQTLPQPALVVAAGLLVLGETTIGVGFLVPGESGLLVAATTATTPGRFLVLWLVVFGCAVVGDSIGYAIGRRYGPRLRETRLIHRYGLSAWDRATGSLQRRGAWAVLVARFFPVVRTLTPAAAGTAGLGYRRFLPAVACGSAAWSLLHVSLGAALGETAKQAEKTLNTGGAVVLAAIAAGGVFWFVRYRRGAAKRAEVPTGTDPAEAPETGPGNHRLSRRD